MIRVESPVDFRMPVDFGSYLLSSSPPAYRSTLASYCHFRPAYTKSAADINRGPVIARKHPPGFTLKSIILDGNKDCTSPGSDGEQSDGLSSPESPTSPDIAEAGEQYRLKSKKRVSFADASGLALEQVRIMSEPSDMPPTIHPGILSAITDGACAGAVSLPPLELCFKQPASDYLKFREKIENNLVSLENVVVRDYSLLGTIKVKNIAFDKKVSLRVTYDSWETTKDVAAKYVPSGSSEESRFDTFSFVINVPPATDPQKSVQFAVCYEVNGEQHWDNNENANYKVMSSYCKKTNNGGKPNGVCDINNRLDRWSEFSSWSRLETSLPYW